MSNDNVKELRVTSFDSLKKVMFLAKQLLVPSETLNIISGTNSAGTASGAAETLRRLGYISYDDIHTETIIEKGSRRTRFIITVRKTKNFDTLYKEHEENKKKLEEEAEMEINQYQMLYESCIAYGMRIFLIADEEKKSTRTTIP